MLPDFNCCLSTQIELPLPAMKRGRVEPTDFIVINPIVDGTLNPIEEGREILWMIMYLIACTNCIRNTVANVCILSQCLDLDEGVLLNCLDVNEGIFWKLEKMEKAN